MTRFHFGEAKIAEIIVFERLECGPNAADLNWNWIVWWRNGATLSSRFIFMKFQLFKQCRLFDQWGRWRECKFNRENELITSNKENYRSAHTLQRKWIFPFSEVGSITLFSLIHDRRLHSCQEISLIARMAREALFKWQMKRESFIIKIFVAFVGPNDSFNAECTFRTWHYRDGAEESNLLMARPSRRCRCT